MEKAADEWGIQARYIDALGKKRRCHKDTLLRLRDSMGAGQYPEGPPVPPGIVFEQRRAAPIVGPGRLRLEGGDEVVVDERLPADLALGYHTFYPKEGSERLVIVCPAACYLPELRRAWGWAINLYAARSRTSWGIGDFSDLRRIAEWSTGLDARMLLLNPLHAPAPTHPQQPSPYFPSSRRFLSPLYLRIEEVPGAGELGSQLESLAASGRALNDQRLIDRDEVWRLKRRALEAIWARSPRHEDACREWCAERGAALTQFAAWCAMADRHGADWRSWPADLRHPSSAAVSRFVEDSNERILFWSWVQWLCRRQLAEAGGDLMLMQDLPIGFDPNGADAWAFQDLLAQHVTVGAPPDEFNTQGQDWGLPPFVPWRLRQVGFRPFIETLRETMARGGGIRIDHVMGFHRQWWIPGGASAADGAFVRYPAEEMLAITALESHRAQAVVVGEDLGTVDPWFRKRLERRRVLSYRLLWFEEHDPSEWTEAALAAITTHDLPTVAGLWSGTDLEEQRELGLEPNVASTEAIRERLAQEAGLPPDASESDAVVGAHRLLARSASRFVTATLDDAVAERTRPNIPNTEGRRPNWSIPLPLPVEELPQQRLVQEVADTLASSVRTHSAP